MGSVKLRINDLLLDAENPRIEAADSQREALRKIIDDQEEKLYALAENIVEAGLSPIDRLLVMPVSRAAKQRVVLEGNRRVAALKILSNPTVLSDMEISRSVRERFEMLSGEFDKSSVEPIDGFEVGNREEGNRWIHLRHTGENEGRGVVGWTGVAAARFRGEDPALQAIQFVKAFGGLTSAQQELLGHYFPITTLDRLLQTPEVRRLIGIEITNHKLSTSLPADEVIKPLRRLVLDLAEKTINVTGLKSRAQQIDYVKGLPKEDTPNLSTSGSTRPIESVSAGEFSSVPSAKPRPRRLGALIGRRTVVPARLRLRISDAKTARIFKELQAIKTDALPNAGAVLLRVFLELSVDQFLDKNQIPLTVTPKGNRSVDKSLGTKVKEAIEHLVTATGANRKDFLSVSRGLSVPQSPFSIDLLHAYVHNRFVTPKGNDLISAWDDAQPFFEQLWG